MSAAYMKCMAAGVRDIVITVHPSHAGFYRRIGFRPMGDGKPRPYDKVNSEAVGLTLDVNAGIKNPFIAQKLVAPLLYLQWYAGY